MHIKLCFKDNIFQSFRSEDIISIEPSWLAEDTFDCYYVQLANHNWRIELSQKQGNALIEMLDYKAISPEE
jgi:hypothetical protein